MEQFALHRFPHDSRKEQHVLKRCAWQPGSQQLTNKLLATLTFNASGAHDVKLAAENTRLTANQLKAPFRLVKVCRAACAGDRHVISCFKYKKLQGQHKWTIFCMFVLLVRALFIFHSLKQLPFPMLCHHAAQL